MADPIPQQPIVESTSSTVITVAEDAQDHEPIVRVKLRKPKAKKSVKWTTETVDNEHMNRKKSKCCCIYEKPKENFDDSSSEDSDDECEHCHGHVDKKKGHHSHEHPVPAASAADPEVPSTSEVSQTVTISPAVEEEDEVFDRQETVHMVLKNPTVSPPTPPLEEDADS